MTKEEAKEFLIDIAYKLGNMAVEYLTEKDGEKMRDAVETLEQEPRKGHWINMANPCMSDNIVCSECGYNSIADFKFCPNCGAEMESEEV